MSQEKITRVKPDLPRGDWTIVLRLVDYVGLPYGEHHAEFLQDVLPKTKTGTGPQARVTAHEGALYADFPASDTNGREALARDTEVLWNGIARLALDACIEAHVAPTNQVSTERPIAESFPYMDDVTEDVRDLIEDLKLQPRQDTDMFLELDQLLKTT